MIKCKATGMRCEIIHILIYIMYMNDLLYKTAQRSILVMLIVLRPTDAGPRILKRWGIGLSMYLNNRIPICSSLFQFVLPLCYSFSHRAADFQHILLFICQSQTIPDKVMALFAKLLQICV